MIASVKNFPVQKLLKLVVVLSVVVVCLNPSIGSADEKAPPNIVVFLVDDLGQMDIGPNNPKCFYETPNIDTFAKSAMRFTCLLYTSPSPRDATLSRMPSSA